MNAHNRANNTYSPRLSLKQEKLKPKSCEAIPKAVESISVKDLDSCRLPLRKINRENIPAKATAKATAKVTSITPKLGISNSHLLKTIKEQEILEFLKDSDDDDDNDDDDVRENDEAKKALKDTKSLVPAKQKAYTPPLKQGNGNNKRKEIDDDSSSSDLSDSEIVGPIPKTESDINVVLINRNLRMNIAKRTPQA